MGVGWSAAAQTVESAEAKNSQLKTNSFVLVENEQQIDQKETLDEAKNPSKENPSKENPSKENPSEENPSKETSEKTETKITVDGLNLAAYICEVLTGLNIHTVFTSAGDYIAPFLNLIPSGIKVIASVDPQEMAYAADGYSRATGNPGVIITSYGDSLKIVNAIAASFVEHIPIIIINGAPTNIQWQSNLQLHGTIGSPNGIKLNQQVFELITVNSKENQLMYNAVNATDQINNSITACLTYSQPIYLEFPSNIWVNPTGRLNAVVPTKTQGYPTNNPDNATEAAYLVKSAIMKHNSKVLVWAGEEIAILGLQNEFKQFIVESGLTYLTTLHSNLTLKDNDANFGGILDGGFADQWVLNKLEVAEAIVRIGTIGSDFDFNGFEQNLAPNIITVITIARNSLQANGVSKPDVNLSQFFYTYNSIFGSGGFELSKQVDLDPKPPKIVKAPIPEVPLYYDNFVEALIYTEVINSSTTLFCDTSLVLVSAANAVSKGKWQVGTLYSALGYSLGGSVGYKCGLVEKGNTSRVVTLVGDAGLQSCISSLSTLGKYSNPDYRLNNVLFVLVNQVAGFAQLREDVIAFYDTSNTFPAYNELNNWDYEDIAKAVGGTAKTVVNLDELLTAISEINPNSNQFYLIVVVLASRKSFPAALHAYISVEP